jgi:O-antigen/teichoic acid export membrane protein
MGEEGTSGWRRWLGWITGRGVVGRSADRYRRAIWTTLASGVAKLGGLVSMLILVPLVMRHLGEERAGVWMTMNSLTVLVGFADLGMGTGLMTRVAQAMGAQREDEARRAISSCFFVLAGVAGLLAVVFAGVNGWIPWERVLRTSADLTRGELASAMLAFVVVTLGGLPFSLVERVQSGQQEGFASHLWQGAGTLLSLGGVVVALGRGWGLAGVLWAGLGLRMLVLVANWWVYFRRQRRSLCPRWSEWDRGTAVEMMRLGLVFLWLNVLAFNWWLVDPILITQALGAEAVAGYGAMQRLFAVGLVGQYLVMPLWPAFGEALARGDHGWVRVTLRRALVLTVGLTGILGLALVVWGRWITRLWLDTDFVPGLSLLAGMAALNLLLIVAWNLSGVLVHGVYLRRQAGLYTLAAVLALTLKLVWVRSWGLPGVVWASVVAFGLVYAPMAFRLAAEAARGPRPGPGPGPGVRGGGG